jgi:hypothetical protein
MSENKSRANEAEEFPGCFIYIIHIPDFKISMSAEGFEMVNILTWIMQTLA